MNVFEEILEEALHNIAMLTAATIEACSRLRIVTKDTNFKEQIGSLIKTISEEGFVGRQGFEIKNIIRKVCTGEMEADEGLSILKLILDQLQILFNANLKAKEEIQKTIE